MTTTSSADISTVTRRDLLRSVGVVGLAVLGAACAPLAPGAAAPTSSAASVSTPSTPRSGGTLRMGIIGDYPTLEGETVAPISQDNLWGVWDRLIAQDVTTQPRPMLAESWDVSPDHTQITFHLRQGVKFHTGRELTSDDVKFSLQRLQDPKVASSMLGRSRTMSAWDTPDRYTIVVTANRPWPDAFDLIQYVNIIDPETFASAGLATPVGTGPFKFQEYQQGDHLTLVKNPDYWMTGRPYLDRIVTSVFSNSQSAITQLEAGALDVVDAPPVVDTVRLATDAQYQVLVNNVTGGFWNVLPNCQKEPTSDKLVRQALNYALDRQRITDSIWQGLAKPEALPWSSSSPAYDASKNTAYAFDLEKAQALLNQAGVSNLAFDISWTTAVPDYAKAAQIYQADLAKLGITTTLKPLEGPVYFAALQGLTYTGLMFSGGLNGHLAPGSMILGPFYGPTVNNSGFTDDGYTQLANAVLTAVDPDKQNVLYAQLNDYYLDQSWVMPISQNPPHMIARTSVQGLRYDGREALLLQDVSIAA